MKTYQNPSDIFDDPTTPLFPLQLAVFLLPKKKPLLAAKALLDLSLFPLPFLLFSFLSCLPQQASRIPVPSASPKALPSPPVFASSRPRVDKESSKKGEKKRKSMQKMQKKKNLPPVEGVYINIFM